ncbi:MAG: hypothetical protein JXB26_17900 [Candidatus Aminicenantes bacterium]|nr:hypothetical protein [Candidatus Aminicenantes bacterium]
MIEGGVKIGEARIGLRSTNSELFRPDRFFWMDTNFQSVETIPFDEARDSRVDIFDGPQKEGMTVDKDILILHGDFSRWEKETNDRRHSLFGNLGIFSSWVLRTLEEKHGIFTLHACALEKKSRLLIIVGGAGSGKSVFLLSALKKGWSLFSTEFVHFSLKRNLNFFKGSIKDAVRVDTLNNHFSGFARDPDIAPREEKGGKMVVDLAAFQTVRNHLESPDVFLVFPHVENKWDKVVWEDIKSRENLLRELFLNVSEKLGKSLLLYGRMPVPGIDTFELGRKRFHTIELLLDSGRIKRALRWISGVGDAAELFEIIKK